MREELSMNCQLKEVREKDEIIQEGNTVNGILNNILNYQASFITNNSNQMRYGM